MVPRPRARNVAKSAATRSRSSSAQFPKFTCYFQRVDTQSIPPFKFFVASVSFSVMCSTQRHREFITDLLAEPFGLLKAQVVSVRRFSAANQAGLRSYKS